MKIAVDIDMVLADSNTPFLKWYNRTFKTNVKRDDIKDYDMSSALGCSLEEAITRTNHFLKMNQHLIVPIEGSVESVSRLRKEHELVTLTSRPLFLVDETKEWVEKYFPGVFSMKLFCDGHTGKTVYVNKLGACREFSIELFIEDSLKYVNEVASAGIPSLLFDLNKSYGWNKGKEEPLVTRVHSWKEVEEYLRHLR